MSCIARRIACARIGAACRAACGASCTARRRAGPVASCLGCCARLALRRCRCSHSAVTSSAAGLACRITYAADSIGDIIRPERISRQAAAGRSAGGSRRVGAVIPAMAADRTRRGSVSTARTRTFCTDMAVLQVDAVVEADAA